MNQRMPMHGGVNIATVNLKSDKKRQKTTLDSAKGDNLFNEVKRPA